MSGIVSARRQCAGETSGMDRNDVASHRRRSQRIKEPQTLLDELQQLQVDYARAVARAEQQEHQAQALIKMSRGASVSVEMDELRQSIVEALHEALRADTASLFLRQPDGTLRMVAQCNIDLTRARLIFGPDEGLAALAARERRVVHVPDTAAHSHYLSTGYDRPRSLLAVPLETQAGPEYVLCVVRRRVYAFTDDEVQFAHLMANVAAQALSNAALYHEMSALAREQSTLYELAHAASISDGPTGFAGRAVEPLRVALNATGCAVLLLLDPFDTAPDERPRAVSSRLTPLGLQRAEAFAGELQGGDRRQSIAIRCDVTPDGSRLILAPVLARAAPVAVIAWESLIGGASETGQEASAEAVWDAEHSLAIEARSESQGLRLIDPRLPLTDIETAFIASVSQQLALGIENLRLRARDLGALRAISTLPASRPHLDHLRRGLVDEIAAVFAPASVILIMRDEASGLPREVAATSDASDAWIRAAVRLAGDDRGQVIRQQRGLVLAALIADGETIGWLAVRPQVGHLTADRTLLLTSLAGAAALLLRNARLHLMAREAAVDRERQRIAREIHDGVAQNLAHLLLRLDLVQRLISSDPERARDEAEGSREVLLTSLSDLRRSIAALAPAQLEELGFAGAVQALLDDVATNSPDLTVSFTTCPDEDIPIELRAPAFRAVQEALSNIRKHAHAAHAWVDVAVRDGALHVTVRDDGQGFAPDLNGPASGHFGLRGLRDRAEEFGGTLTIASKIGKGTTITLHLPLALAA
jgi:signal transduction histidine kinase